MRCTSNSPAGGPSPSTPDAMIRDATIIAASATKPQRVAALSR